MHVYKDYYPPIAGGMECHMALMCSLQSKTENVRALTCSRSIRSREVQYNGVTVHEVGEWGRFQSAPLSPSFPRHLKRGDADVVVLHVPNPTGEIAFLASRSRAKLVVRYQSDVVRQAVAMRIYGPFFRRLLARADAILVSSPQYLETSTYLQPVRDQCRVVPLGILAERFDHPRGERVAELRKKYGGRYVLFSGRHRWYKGLEYLVEASTRIPGPIVIAGEGTERRRIMKMAEKLGSGIFFPGELSEEDLVDHLHGCAVFVLPSVERSEAFGIGILEAHACAKPVVATRLGTGVEYVNLDGETGMNVSPRDPRALAEAITTLLEDSGRCEAMGRFASTRVRKDFDARDVAAEELEVYRKVLEGT